MGYVSTHRLVVFVAAQVLAHPATIEHMFANMFASCVVGCVLQTLPVIGLPAGPAGSRSETVHGKHICYICMFAVGFRTHEWEGKWQSGELIGTESRCERHGCLAARVCKHVWITL